MKPLSAFIVIFGIMFLLSSLNTGNTTELLTGLSISGTGLIIWGLSFIKKRVEKSYRSNITWENTQNKNYFKSK
ncbi:hypothetical protein DXA95_04545 [Odoribacter sp. OF09-27XD]|jgi:hypothetical protein|nr:hypothetical protein DXA95_04545 [Odoribacter sp. OF09-27XD]